MLSPDMLRDAIRKLSLRKKLTILAILGVLLPVGVLTYLQYRSLTELENKTKGAFKDSLRQRLTNVQLQMKQRLEDVAAQTLNPIGSIQFSSVGSTEEIEKYFANTKRSHPAVEEIFAFVYPYTEQQANPDRKQDPNSYAYIYSDKFVKIPQPGFTPTQANILSLFDRARIAQNFVDGNRNYLFVHHSCPPCPTNTRQGTYLFYPLKDRTEGRIEGEQSGFAGVLLNERFVNDDLLAGSIKAAITSAGIAISISDENQRVLYSNAAPQNGYIIESNFDRPFSNWKAGIGLKNANLEDIGRGSFVHSLAATVLILRSYFVVSALPYAPLTAKHVWRRRNQTSSQMSRMN